MPKRPIFALLAAGTALVLMLNFKTPADTAAGSSSQQGNGNGPGSGGGPGNTVISTGSGTFTGNAVNTRYGTVQVQITVQNGKITNVQALQAPSDNPYSAQVSSYAIPQLIAAALQAQSAQVDTISGATSTSHGFIQSLQSALAQVKL
jgi:uncharacterized protein with FMN-binding domain